MELEMLEVVARTGLMDVLLKDGVKIALPIGDNRIDMLASIESRAISGIWIPLRVIAVYADALSRRFEEEVLAPGLLVAVVWDTVNPIAVRTYRTFALTPAELTVVKMVALIARNGAPRAAPEAHSGRTEEQVLQNALEPFAISPGQWLKKLATLLKDDFVSRA
jgi:hypothetical protein